MSPATGALAAKEDPIRERRRVLGRVRGARPGATLLGIGGLHGNEPAGVAALERVVNELWSRRTEMAGEFVALAGNLSALATGRRFVDRDLNRAWTSERLQRLREEGHLNGLAEDREQVELLDAIEEVIESARGPVYVVDLHTTSGFGGPFTTFGDTLSNRHFAAHIPVPMVLGIEELVDGTLLAFLGRHGLVAVAYETGQHDEVGAVERAEAGLWISVAAAGLLPEAEVPKATEGRKRLGRESADLPRVMEMIYRHDISPEDGFRMDPGWANFRPVGQGQRLGSDAGGTVGASATGRVLMPLYQAQGEDGFFLIREFHPFWLSVSTALRRTHVDRLAHWLPGVSREPGVEGALVVDKRVARWYAVKLFHLLGYRRVEDQGQRVVMRRRRYDDTRFIAHPPVPEHLK